MRIVGLNIQMGGGERVGRIAAALRDLDCDVIVLSEVGSWASSMALLADLRTLGWPNVAASVLPNPEVPNGVAVASRMPIVRARAPLPSGPNAGRVLEAEIAGLLVVAVYLPLDKEHEPFWRDEFGPYLETIAMRPAVVIGDWNTGEPYVDQPAAKPGGREFVALRKAGWTDAWRAKHGAEQD